MNFAAAIPASYFDGPTVCTLTARIHQRDKGDHELRFDTRQLPALLPVIVDGQLVLARWGAERNDPTKLPVGKFTWRLSIEEGKWSSRSAMLARIPADRMMLQGVWQDCQGLLALVVPAPNEDDPPWAWVVVQPAGKCDLVMYRNDWVPMKVSEAVEMPAKEC